MLILIALVLVLTATWGGWTGFVSTTRKCKKCKGVKVATHRGWFHPRCLVVCPRCGGKGREMRPVAYAVRRARQKRRGARGRRPV